jgi:hypothetical protein
MVVVPSRYFLSMEMHLTVYDYVPEKLEPWDTKFRISPSVYRGYSQEDSSIYVGTLVSQPKRCSVVNSWPFRPNLADPPEGWEREDQF